MSRWTKLLETDYRGLHVYVALEPFQPLYDSDRDLNEMIRKKPSRLVVDLSRVTYIDSSGLAVLIEAMQDVEEYGGKFALAGLHDDVRSIFQTARVDQVFLTYPHVDAALAAD